MLRCAFVVGMGATLVILFGTVVASESMMHFLSFDGVILCGALAPAAAAMVVVGTLVENGRVSEPVTAMVQQHAAAATDEQPGVSARGCLFSPYRQRRLHGWTCQRPYDKDKGWSSLKRI